MHMVWTGLSLLSKRYRNFPMGERKVPKLMNHLSTNHIVDSGCGNYSALSIATSLYNILDMPVGCLPVTRVDAAKDLVTREWEGEAGHGSSILEKGVFYGPSKLYDPWLSNGMPVNIQLVGRKWEDEKVLAMMKVVDDALGKDRGFGPGAWDRYQESLLKD